MTAPRTKAATVAAILASVVSVAGAAPAHAADPRSVTAYADCELNDYGSYGFGFTPGNVLSVSQEVWMDFSDGIRHYPKTYVYTVTVAANGYYEYDKHDTSMPSWFVTGSQATVSDAAGAVLAVSPEKLWSCGVW